MAYSTLQFGSSGADVLTLKKLLNTAGFSLPENEIFDQATVKAVSDYQSAHQLPVSGSANAATWAKLAANVVTALPNNLQTPEAVRFLENNRPAAYTSAYTEQLDSLLDQVLNREKFAYDPTQDELYNRYRDQYVYMSRRAMNDARGGAATLTGGYDNSFAESVGQQAYQNQLAQLSDKLPELYKLALAAYDDETGRLENSLSTLTAAEKTAYQRYQDDLDRYTEALKYYYEKLKDEQAQANWEILNADKIAAANASGGSSGGSAAPSQPEPEPDPVARAVEAAAIQKALPNILTQNEFEQRKAAGSASLKNYDTYADYAEAMKEQYMPKTEETKTTQQTKANPTVSAVAPAAAKTTSAATSASAKTTSTSANSSALANILTQSEFQRRKNAGATSLKQYKTYAEYTAAMKKKYGG